MTKQIGGRGAWGRGERALALVRGAAGRCGWAWGLVLAACGGGEPPEDDAAEVTAPEVVRLRPDAGGDAAGAVALTPQQAKLVELAAASECARREGVPVERAISRLEALFATQGMSLVAYSEAMAGAVEDEALQLAIEARLEGCAGLVAGLWPAAPERGVEVAEAPEPAQDVGGEVPDAREDGVAEAEAEADAEGEPEAEPVPEKPAKPSGPTWTGTWTGALTGAAKGTLRVTVNGRTVTGAQASIGRLSLRLKGTFSEKGFLTLGGTQGDEFLRVYGKVERGGQVMTGTWDGVVDRKRASGKLRISR